MKASADGIPTGFAIPAKVAETATKVVVKTVFLIELNCLANMMFLLPNNVVR
jgi:hypothetical protein